MVKRILILTCVSVLYAVGVSAAVGVDSLSVDSVSLPLEVPSDSVQSLPPDSVTSDTTVVSRFDYRKKKGIMRPVYMLLDYLSKTNKESDKAFDWSIAAGPSYNPNSSFSIGGVVSALYNWDNKLKKTHFYQYMKNSELGRFARKSDLSLFFNFGFTGYVEVGIRGNNYMPADRQRWTYELAFRNVPSDIWGFGWDRCSDNRYKGNYRSFQLYFAPDYLFRVADSLYVGAAMNVLYNTTRKFRNPIVDGKEVDLLEGQWQNLVSTGIGAELIYDSRDNGLNAYTGHYFRLQQLYYVPGVNHYSFWSTDVNYRTYVPLWTKCVLAMEVHGLFNYGGTIPWTKMAMTGTDGRMRGYYVGRYRDNNIMEGTIEFRQRIKWRLGVVAWAGCANVFHDFHTIAWRKTLPNYGLGVRWEFKTRVNIRLDYGFGRDDGGVVFNINEAF